MNGKIRTLWNDIRTSYWFFPGIMAVAAVALSILMIEIDRALEKGSFSEFRWVSGAGADGVRAVLQTIAGSMITVAGTVFSITIIALTLASQQFGPRILRNFMRDRGNQMVLGTFTATFLYCILVLRTVSGQEDATFVPHASALAAVILAIISVGVLIYFIHHTAIMIQAPHVIANVADELDEQIDRLFPATLGRPHPGNSDPQKQRYGAIPADFDDNLVPVCKNKSGYLQYIDESTLLSIASEHNLIISLRMNPGTFAIKGEPCLHVYTPGGAKLPEEVSERLAKTLTFGRARTAEQDVSFAIDQLVEVAARALSPSLNDPFTAISCIDRLGAAFAHLATREIPSAHRFDDDGQLRVIAQPLVLVNLVIQSLEPIRQYGASHMLIALRLLDTLAIVGPFIHREEDRQVLLAEIDRISRSAEKEHEGDPQRRRIAGRAETARQTVLTGQPSNERSTSNPMH